MIVEQFDPAKNYHELKKFSCGHADIDKFVVGGSLKKQAQAHQAIAYAVLDETKQDKFVGFYTLTMSDIGRDVLQPLISGSMPKRIGCTRLVMLGVDSSCQKTHDKLGLRLLKHALNSTKVAAQAVGCRGMYLDADAKAVDFYKNYGFAELAPPSAPGAPTPMFLPIESFF
jgi:predicted GNAT family N-acyltransferase